MIITVSDQYRIKVNDCGWLVQGRTDSKIGCVLGMKHQGWQDLHYFFDLDELAEWMIMVVTDEESIDDLIDSFSQAAAALRVIAEVLEGDESEYCDLDVALMDDDMSSCQEL